MTAVPITRRLLIRALEALEVVYVLDQPTIVHYQEMIPYNHVSITPW